MRDAIYSAEFRHRDDCPRERLAAPRRGRDGDLLVRCLSCKTLTIVRVPKTAEPEPEAELPPVASSNYVCRVHLDVPVTWRGTGCPACGAEREASRASRRRRRAAPAEAWEVA